MTSIAQPVRRPIVPSEVLGMALFLFTEVMLFCGLISGYLVLRTQAGVWPPLDQPRLPVEATALNTLLLVLSAWPMWRSINAVKSRDYARASKLVAVTLLLGTSFLILQGVEWVSLIQYGLTSSSSLYGSLFYTLVGCHAFHVLIALFVLGGAWRGVGRGKYSADAHGGLSAIRMYWIFVVAVWPPLYALVYLW